MSDTAGTMHDETSALGDPDCLECLRLKLKATCVVVFFQKDGEWRIGNFQGEKPREHAEVDFYCMLESSLPAAVSQSRDGVLFVSDRQLLDAFGAVGNLFKGNTVVAAPVTRGSTQGIRLAWRDAREPFSQEDLELIRCTGLCPEC